MVALFAFLSSLSFALSALALAHGFGPVPVELGIFERSPAVPWADLQSVALIVALGLVVRFPAKDGRVAVFPRVLALAQIACGIAPAIVARIATEGFYAGDSINAIVLRAFLLAPLAFTFGQSARRVLLHAGVPKADRLPEWGAVVAGLALGAMAWLCLESRLAASTIAIAASLVLLVRFVLPQLDRADMPEPEPYEGGLRCVPLLAGAALLAYAVAAALAIEVQFGDRDTFATWQCGALGAGAIGFAIKRGSVRRSGLVLGTVALIALALRAFSNSWHDRFGGFGSLASLMAQGACLGAGLALLARFYFEVPRARKILAQIPEDQRRTPAGAPACVALLFAGLAIGAWFGVPRAQFAATLDRNLCIGAIGAALLVCFDPRAGIARRVTWLALGGGAFTVAVLI